MRHYIYNIMYIYFSFQSTHPMRGATSRALTHGQSSVDFNPRTPCGVRHVAAFYSDHVTDFNPRTPCGVRQSVMCSNTNFLPFQSTHPMRGATCTVRAISAALDISIHAPHAGCDDSTMPASNWISLFQSTHPMRGATLQPREI